MGMLQRIFLEVPHQRLLLLKTYGIQGDLLQWLSDFLIGRKQKVVIVNDTSSWYDVKSGVPQGSVLGPVSMSTISIESLFADDTKLYRSITSDLDSIQLQKGIDNFLEWSQLWLLNMNNNKCKGMRIAFIW